jgi:hypothetical protein
MFSESVIIVAILTLSTNDKLSDNNLDSNSDNVSHLTVVNNSSSVSHVVKQFRFIFHSSF